MHLWAKTRGNREVLQEWRKTLENWSRSNYTSIAMTLAKVTVRHFAWLYSMNDVKVTHEQTRWSVKFNGGE